MRRRRTSSARVDAPETLERLGIPRPVPFIGRDAELLRLESALESAHLVVVTGAAGSGKTALLRELMVRPAAIASGPAAYVLCEEGDLAEAVVARAERALDVTPGGLARALASTPRFLVIDEIHRLTPEMAAKLVGKLARPGGVGRLLVASRDALPVPREDAGRVDLTIDGLAESDAHALWTKLEETYGPTPRGACDSAIERTRGVPLALRREFARAHDKKAWDIAALGNEEKKLLAAAAVLRVTGSPAALAHLAGVAAGALEPALRALVAKQLLSPLGDGRLECHDVVRAATLAALTPAERKTVEAAAASICDDADTMATAWEQVDGAALSMTDPVERLREAVRHLAAAGKAERAVDRLCESEDLFARLGASGEVLASVARLEAAGAGAPKLSLLRARVLARSGRLAEALDVHEQLERELGDKLDRVAPEARVAHAELSAAAGDVEGASKRLAPLVDHLRPEVRAAAQIALASLELERGQIAAARKLLKAVDAGKAPLSPAQRTRTRLLAATADEREGKDGAARAILARLAASGADGADAAAVLIAQAGALAEEGRHADAEALYADAERAARAHDALRLAEDVRRRAARLAARAGRPQVAEATLREIAASARERGDEVSALRAELSLAETLLVRGRAAEAARVAGGVVTGAGSRGLSVLASEARLAKAIGELDELRLVEARDILRLVLADESAPAAVKSRAALLLVIAEAWAGLPGELPAASDENPDTVARLLAQGELLLARGDSAAALEKITQAAVEAARAGRTVELARAMADAARLQLAVGDRAQALEAASRAVTEGAPGGLDRVVTRALLVRAALSRDEGDLPAAREHAAAALTVARAAGLGPERLAAATAAELCAREAGDTSNIEPIIAQRSAAAATLAEVARAAVGRHLGDLGLTPARPYRLVTGAGASSYVAEIDAVALKLDKRSLVIDGGREQIIRSGAPIADLRRRSLLKRLLFLFAGAPNRSFSKEDIVQRVWGVDYHPLRHDAALFTNIMRLRRLLGEGGDEILRVGEAGYRLVPPTDFLFVDKLSS